MDCVWCFGVYGGLLGVLVFWLVCMFAWVRSWYWLWGCVAKGLLVGLVAGWGACSGVVIWFLSCLALGLRVHGGFALVVVNW